MFVIEKPKLEAPLLGAAMGGMMAAGAGWSTAAVVGASIAGGVGMHLLSKSMAPAKMSGGGGGSPPAVPQTAPPTSMPATPATPAASPVTGGGLGAPTNRQGGDTPVDTSGPVPETFKPGEGSAPTSQEIARGELERKRKGRVATILTRRNQTVGEEENEKLGGATGGI